MQKFFTGSFMCIIGHRLSAVPFANHFSSLRMTVHPKLFSGIVCTSVHFNKFKMFHVVCKALTPFAAVSGLKIKPSPRDAGNAALQDYDPCMFSANRCYIIKQGSAAKVHSFVCSGLIGTIISLTFNFELYFTIQPSN